VDPVVWVVVPSYNAGPAVLECLDSLAASTYPGLHFLLVDDASRDASVEVVRRRFPACRLLSNAENVGFATTSNRGLELALAEGADFVLLLNQDTRVAPDTVARLVAALESRPRAAIVAPKTYSFHDLPDGRPRLLYAGAWRRSLPLRQRIPGIDRADTGEPSRPVETDYAWGHGMLLRATALRTTGLFDPAFPMYYEDLDLCRRMKAAGFEIWCEPRALMWHDVADGARALHSEAWRWAAKARGTLVFHAKHYGGWRAPVLSIATFADELLALLVHGRFRAAWHLALGALRAPFARR
jgi:hypothetical protein